MMVKTNFLVKKVTTLGIVGGIILTVYEAIQIYKIEQFDLSNCFGMIAAILVMTLCFSVKVLTLGNYDMRGTGRDLVNELKSYSFGKWLNIATNISVLLPILMIFIDRTLVMPALKITFGVQAVLIIYGIFNKK